MDSCIAAISAGWSASDPQSILNPWPISGLPSGPGSPHQHLGSFAPRSWGAFFFLFILFLFCGCPTEAGHITTFSSEECGLEFSRFNQIVVIDFSCGKISVVNSQRRNHTRIEIIGMVRISSQRDCGQYAGIFVFSVNGSVL